MRDKAGYYREMPGGVSAQAMVGHALLRCVTDGAAADHRWDSGLDRVWVRRQVQG